MSVYDASTLVVSPVLPGAQAETGGATIDFSAVSKYPFSVPALPYAYDERP
jgi:hypothetical protein